MSCKKYSYAKSIRLQEDVLEFIEACPGNGFSEKFHHAIRQCRDGDEELKKRLKYYDDLITKRRCQLAEISKDVGMLNERLNTIRVKVQNIESERNYYPH